ncbi:hypothetical protein MBLNU457_7143t1 [Dothideomycetes sp. NU457]
MTSIASLITDHTFLTLLITTTLLAVAMLALYPNNLLKYLQRKRYQYEVTFSLYMMTPTEKFIFNSILFLFLAMVTIAASLYLPSHISVIGRRAYYYALGDADAATTKSVVDGIQSLTQEMGKATQAATEAATRIVETVVGQSTGTGGRDL